MNNLILTAREAILQELKRRWNSSPTRDNVTVPLNSARFHHPQTNYFCGSGSMPCPICHTGSIQYSRASSNGHVHAKCSTDGCVAWME